MLNYNWMPENVKTVSMAYDMYDICSNLVQPLCTPNEGGEGRERRTVYDNICFFDM